MGELSVREVRLLQRLLRSPDGLTLKLLAEEEGLATRTLQRELPALESWLAAMGLRLVVRSRVGLSLEGTQAQREVALALLRAGLPARAPTAEERQNLILQELLRTRGGTKLAYFAHKYDVTESTISTDLDRLEGWMRERGLTLIRRPGFGIDLIGSERAFRRAIIDFLRRNLTDEEMYELIRSLSGGGLGPTHSDIMGRLLQFADEETVVQIEAAVQQMAERAGLHLADSALAGLVVHLALAVERLRLGEEVRFPGDALASLRGTREWDWAWQLRGLLEERLALALPEDEVGYITMHLRGARLRNSTAPFSEPDPEQQEAVEVARAMAARAEELLRAPVSAAPGFIHGLALHLVPAMNRIRMGLEIRNPLLPQIAAEYPELLAACRQVCQLLEQRLGTHVPEAEVGYVAMHLGAALERLKSAAHLRFRTLVVCATGVGSSQMLASRLGHALPEAELMDVVSAVELSRYLADLAVPPDLILSTVPLNVPQVPVVVVSPLLRADDVAAVKRVLQELPAPAPLRPVPADAAQGGGDARPGAGLAAPVAAPRPEVLARRAAVVGALLLALLQGFRLQEFDGRDPVGAAVELAEATGMAGDPAAIQRDLERREVLGATMVAEGLQLLHARTAGVLQPFVGLLRRPGKAILVMLAPQEASPEALEVLGAISVALVEQPGFTDALEHGTEEENKDYIGRIVQPLIFKVNTAKVGG